MFGVLNHLFSFAAQSRDVVDYYNTYDTTAAAGAAGFFGVYTLVICCCAVGGLVINIFLTYWVYQDAKKHNVENPVLWAILTFFFNIIGLLVYFLAIRPQAMQGGSVNTTATTMPKPEVKKEEKPEHKA